MGVVYRAFQPSLERDVALKLVTHAAGDGEDLTVRLEREARVMAGLKHPHIVAVHDFGQLSTPTAETIYYLVLEYIDGASLQELMDRGPLEKELALRVIPQICDALHYSHGRGVVHRDIKPSNILLDASADVKLTDFGLAKVSSQDRDMTLTSTNVTMGTPSYMAPEQLKHTSRVDERADLYSLGVVFYQMLTGELPQGSWEAPTTRRGDLDGRFDTIITRAIRPDPEARYQKARELKEAVTQLSGDTKRTAGNWWRWSALGTGLFVAAIVILPLMSPSGKAPRTMPQKPVRILDTHSDAVMRTAFLPDDPTMALSAGWDGKLVLWDLVEGIVIRESIMNRRIADFAVLKGQAIVCKIEGNLSSYDHRNGKRLRDFGWEADLIQALPNRNGFVAAHRAIGEVRFFKIDGVVAERSWTVHTGQLVAMVALPGGSGLVTAGHDASSNRSEVKLWDLDSAALVRTFEGVPAAHGTGALAVNPFGTFVAYGPGGSRNEDTLFVWNLATGELVARFPGHGAAGIQSLYFHPNDDRFLVAGSNDQTLRIWDIEQRNNPWKVWEPTPVTTNLAVSPDGRFALGGAGYKITGKLEKTDDYALRLWALPDLEKLGP